MTMVFCCVTYSPGTLVMEYDITPQNNFTMQRESTSNNALGLPRKVLLFI